MRGETETEFKTQFLSALNKSGVTQESFSILYFSLSNCFESDWYFYNITELRWF